MMQVNSSVLGNNWFQTFSQFRLFPETFFDKKKITREAFCLDLLKDLHVDSVDIQCKIHLLLLLQEHSNLLIKEANLLEQVAVSLVYLFNNLKSSNENRFYRSQVLLTITTILLSSDLENGVEDLISVCKKLLLKVILSKNEDYIVISAACKCLEEVEVYFPTTLEPELKNILSSCEAHLSPAFQSYATLLSLSIKNICLHPSDVKTVENENTKTDSAKEEIQVSNLVSYLIDLIPLMTPLSVYRVLKNLIPVVKHSNSVSSMVFKLFLPNLIFSSDVPYFNLAFDFLENFGSDLFTIQEENCLIRQLMLQSTHPCLTLSHRMLFLDWFKSCILNKELFSSSPLPILKTLLPGPFDGPVTQEKKSSVLALYLTQNFDENLSLEVLNESISGLKKSALLPNGTKAATSYFRTLFVYFTYYKSELMYNYMYKLLLGIMKTSSHLLHYVLSFLDAVKVKFPHRTFPKEALSHMVNHILSLPMKQLTSNLECYLAILEQASEICGPECKPRSILRCLQKLLVSSDSHEKNAWEFGNNLLSVCRSILLFHDVQLLYYDLAEVLCLISQNIDDVDVKDRAKIYYSTLTTLSKHKIQTVFKLENPPKDTKGALASFAPSVNANLQYAPCVQVLSKSVLELVRIKKTWTVSDEDTATYLLPNIDILETYKTFLQSSESVVQLPLLLRHIQDAEKTFDNLYGVVLSSQSSPSCKEISVIEIPVYKKDETANEDTVFHINIVPVEPCPVELFFKVEFTCTSGQNYICHPEPLSLNFKDFFLTLPAPQSLKDNVFDWKKKLFEFLWEEFEKEALLGSDKTQCCKSAICLNITNEELFLLVEEHWKQFVVAKFDDIKHWIAIFLPPDNHLLIKIDAINEKPFLNIVLDDISILPWATLYLQEITKS